MEMMIRHRNRQTSGEPDGEWQCSRSSSLPMYSWTLATTEILDIVHQSLRRKVASLDDDNWMFEPEKGVRF